MLKESAEVADGESKRQGLGSPTHGKLKELEPAETETEETPLVQIHEGKSVQASERTKQQTCFMGNSEELLQQTCLEKEEPACPCQVDCAITLGGQELWEGKTWIGSFLLLKTKCRVSVTFLFLCNQPTRVGIS